MQLGFNPNAHTGMRGSSLFLFGNSFFSPRRKNGRTKMLAAKMINAHLIRPNRRVIPIAADSRVHCLDRGDRENSFSNIKKGVLPGYATQKKLNLWRGIHAGRPETGLPSKKLSVIGKQRETRRYQRIYSDNNSEPKLFDIVVSSLTCS